MPFVFGTNIPLRQGSIDFVTRSAAVKIALATTCMTSLVALIIGIAVGARLGKNQLTPAMTQDPMVNTVQHDYAVTQLGKLNAEIAQLEPRMGRLMGQVSQLRDFEARLKKPPLFSLHGRIGLLLPHQTNDTHSDDADEGGPDLPPRVCTDAANSQQPVVAAQQQVTCLTATLDAYQKQVTAHWIAYTAFPGRMPVNATRIGSPFGNRVDPFTQRLSFHPGQDLPAPMGTPIYASAGGRVIFAGWKGGYGNAVEIDHGNGLVTRYGHSSRILVHKGELVLPGEHIANVGSTGRSTGPHLHFEVLAHGVPVNPVPYLALFMANPHG